MLTKEEYLNRRRRGDTKKAIMEDYGLYHYQLRQLLVGWGIGDGELEALALHRARGDEVMAQKETIVWLDPTMHEDAVRVVKRGMKIVGSIAKKFDTAKFVRVGLMGEYIVVQPSDQGWPMRIDPQAPRTRIVARAALRKELERHGFSAGNDYPATWDADSGMLKAKSNVH